MITPEFRDAVLAVLQEEDTSDAINNIRKKKYTDYDLMRYRQNALTMRFNELDKLQRMKNIVNKFFDSASEILKEKAEK